MNNPHDLLNKWLEEEKEKGAPNPQQAVLSTADLNGIPYARVVAIREISAQEILFFTQKQTRKVTQLQSNPHAVITFWLELFQREVILEGINTPLSEAENIAYWQSYPREAQIRFHSYAPTSSQPIVDKSMLEEKKKHIEETYKDKPLPWSPFYCGFRLKPTRVVFYSYRTDELSDVVEYRLKPDGWTTQLLSP
jgi:pyridoxamine 5'-phosphate oxidase